MPEAPLVVAVLALVIAGSQLPANLIVARAAPAAALITILWVVGLLLLQRARAHSSPRRTHVPER